MTIELDSTLAQAEVLYLSFAQVVADMDRRRAEEPASSAQLRKRGAGQSATEEQNAQVKHPVFDDNLRELLKTGR